MIKYQDKDGKDQEFDPVAFQVSFKTEIVEELNKAVNGSTKGLKNEFKSMFDELKTSLTPNPNPNPNPNPEPSGEPKTIAELNGVVASLQKSLKTVTEERETEKSARTAAEQKARESSRVSAVDRVLADMTFPTAKAKQQFRDAYVGRVAYADDDSLVVMNGDTPIEFGAFLKSEYEESTHFQTPINTRGAGVPAGGTRPVGAKRFDFNPNMSASDVAALPPDQKQAYREELGAVLAAGGH